MSFSLRLALGSIVVSCLVAFAGCGGDDDGAPSGSGGVATQGGQGGEATGQAGGPADGVFECKVLGELCHEAEAAGGNSGAHDCHELGHEADGAACLAGFGACVVTCVDGSEDKLPTCAALGELCHAVDDVDGPLHACHELGHVNDAEVCAAEFDQCARICLAAREQLETPSAAAGASNAGAGGRY